MSRLNRLARLSSLGTRVAARALEGGVREALTPGGLRAKVRHKLQARTAEEMAETLSNLKGAAMKVGQQFALAASSLDLPNDIQRTLSRLNAEAEPVPFPTVRRAIEQSLEAPLDKLFVRIEPEPIGTASLGQAHAATLHDGREVVVKVLHEGIRDSLETDILALRAVLLSGRLFGREKAELEDIFEEVAHHLRLELDYLQEAANIERFAARYGGDDRFILPRTVPSHCSESVLTMDRVRGQTLEDFLATATEEERQRAGLSLAEWFFESTFHHRILHADPHPGNYLFAAGGKVGVLDFGCVKEFDEFFLGSYARTVRAALRGDRDATLEACRDLGVWRGDKAGAGDAIWMFCDAVLSPWREGATVIGDEENLMTRVAPATKELWKYPEIRGSRDMVYLHRTLGGLYTLARTLRVHADWGALLEQHTTYAIDVAEGRISAAS
jgi:predicted unusual protein kinase regulating ubiquinone biosynthesis (AarF/ABC1/UbiB family)